MSLFKSPLRHSNAKQQTYLVTGSAGYIGQHIVQTLLQKPVKRVFGLCMPGDKRQLNEKRNFHSIEIDVLDPKLTGILEETQPDVIIHAVGLDRGAPLKDQLTVHVEGTRHLLQSVVDARLPCRVVLLGSASEYGNYPKPIDENAVAKPLSEYGVSKYSQTIVAKLFAQKYHVPVIIARLFNPYGHSPQNFAVASLAAQIAQQEAQLERNEIEKAQIKVHCLESFRDFIHIDDVVSGLLALAERGYPGEIYNLASGHSVPLRLILDGLLAHSRLKQVEILQEASQEADFSQGVIQKIISHTGWRPQVTLEQGLRDELDYWREHCHSLSMNPV